MVGGWTRIVMFIGYWWIFTDVIAGIADDQRHTELVHVSHCMLLFLIASHYTLHIASLVRILNKLHFGEILRLI